MRDILRRYQPTRLEDLTALNALYRPGPIQGGMIDDFIARKHGKKKVTYDLPALEGNSLGNLGRHPVPGTGDADRQSPRWLLAGRRRHSPPRHGQEESPRRWPRSGRNSSPAARRDKVPAKKAEKIFDLMAEFAGYGFNKSHSCAYALLAYQTAWLKTHYPVEFMAAMLTSETGNIEKVVKYINEARSMSITVLPPDVNSSDVDFTPVGDQIRFGLRAIKNVGENTVKGILVARETLGRFTGFYRVRRIGGGAAAQQARAGKPDSSGGHGWARRASRADDRRDRSRHGARAEAATRARKRPAWACLAGIVAAGAPPPEILPEVEEWPEHEILAGGICDPRLLHLRASARQICWTLEGAEGDGAFLHGGKAQQRGHRRRGNHRAGAADAIAARRPLGNPDFAGPHRRVSKRWCFPEAFQKLEPILKAGNAAAGERTRCGGRRWNARDRCGCAAPRSGGRPSAEPASRAAGLQRCR